MPFRDVGKAAQSAIYRAGAFGRRPAVPTDGTQLEAAARKVMSKRGFAYVAGSAGSEAGAEANRDGVRPVAGRAPDARRHERARHSRRAVRPPARAPAARRAGRRAVDGARRGRPRRRPGAPASRAVTPILSTQALGADGGRRGRARAARRAGTSSTGAATTTSSRASSRRAEACGSEAIVVTLDTAYLGWRPRDLDLGHLPFARGEGIAQYTSRPGVPAARRRARRRRGAAPRREPAAAADPGRGRARWCRCARNHPGDTRATTCARPMPRAAVETFLDVFSRPSLTWADLPRLRALTQPADRAQGDPAPRRRAPRASTQGVDGIFVSNHGGRQVDRLDRGARRAARRRRARSRGRVGPVLFDSGIRCGADVVRRARARGGRRRHRAAVRLRPGAGRRRGRRGGAAQHPGRARPHDGAHRVPHPGRRHPRPPRAEVAAPLTRTSTFPPDPGTFTFAPHGVVRR